MEHMLAFESCSPQLILGVLEGTWSGRGSGTYDGVSEFSYLETVRIQRSPKGFSSYVQETSSLQGVPMHQEMGYLRADETRRTLELLIVQPTGIVEVMEGRAEERGDEYRFRLNSLHVVASTSAKTIFRTGRYFNVRANELRYQLYMEMEGKAFQLHLQAELVRGD